MPPMQHEFLDHPIELTCPHCKYEWTYTATAPAFQCPHCRLHGRVDPDTGEITIRKRGRPRKNSAPTPAGEAPAVPPSPSESLTAEPEIREEPDIREEPSPAPLEPAPIEAAPSPPVRPLARVITGGPAPTGKAWKVGHGWWVVECPFCQRVLQRHPGTTELRITCTGCFREFYRVAWQTSSPPVTGDYVICPNPKCGHSWRRRLATKSPIVRCKYCGKIWDMDKVPEPPVHLDTADLQPEPGTAMPAEHLVATPTSAPATSTDPFASPGGTVGSDGMDAVVAEKTHRSDPFVSAAPSETGKPEPHHKVQIAGVEVTL